MSRILHALGSNPECRARSAGGAARALGDELDLHGLEAVGITLRACARAVLGPCHPAVVLGMHAIVDVVLVGKIARKTVLHGLHALALTRSADGARAPTLPADVLHVGVALNIAAVIGIGE